MCMCVCDVCRVIIVTVVALSRAYVISASCVEYAATRACFYLIYMTRFPPPPAPAANSSASPRLLLCPSFLSSFSLCDFPSRGPRSNSTFVPDRSFLVVCNASELPEGNSRIQWRTFAVSTSFLPFVPLSIFSRSFPFLLLSFSVALTCALLPFLLPLPRPIL